ncbi:hypothetical protein EMCRGX_G003853 [Ephydatia muelleri]
MQSASSSISRAEKRAGKEALSRAKNAVEQGMELLSCRKKLIKLADRSEAGWALVEEYVEDDLAEEVATDMSQWSRFCQVHSTVDPAQIGIFKTLDIAAMFFAINVTSDILLSLMLTASTRKLVIAAAAVSRHQVAIVVHRSK